MNGRERPWREYGALDAFLSASSDEGAQVGKISEGLLIDGRLCANRQGRAHLCDDDSDFSGGNLHPREFLNFVKQPGLPTQSGQQEIGLIASFALERDYVVAREFA